MKPPKEGCRCEGFWNCHSKETKKIRLTLPAKAKNHSAGGKKGRETEDGFIKNQKIKRGLRRFGGRAGASTCSGGGTEKTS